MEHTTKNIKPKQGLITSLLKVFAMFDVHLLDNRNKLEAISIRCINCKQKTFLYLITSTLEEMISKLVLNAILYHMCMSWIICSTEGNEI